MPKRCTRKKGPKTCNFAKKKTIKNYLQMEQFKFNSMDEPAVLLGEVRKMINDFGEFLVDYSNDENYLMELSDLYDRILEWENQEGEQTPASEFFEASEINQIIKFMFDTFKVTDSLKIRLSSVSYDFYWKYQNIACWDNSNQDITK